MSITWDLGFYSHELELDGLTSVLMSLKSKNHKLWYVSVQDLMPSTFFIDIAIVISMLSAKSIHL